MKQIFSFIRWKFVLPIAVVAGASALFLIVFMDPLLERVIEKAGSRINEAKVEVDGFRTKIFKGRVEVRSLRVANKNAPMQNIVETGGLAFQIDLSELVSKRVIIDQADVLGLQFSTPRKTSGALPVSLIKQEEENNEPGAAEKLAAKYKERFQLNLDGMKSDAKAKIDFDVEKLNLTQTAEELKETALDLPAQWDKSIQDLNAEGRLKKIEDDIKSIKSTPTKGTEALMAVPEALKKLKTSREELDQLKSDVKDLRQTASSQLQDVKNAPKQLMEAKKKDVDDLMSRFNLDFADPDRLVEGMIGPMVLDRFQTIFKYVQLARQHMPSQKEKASLPSKPRAQGMDIEFPTPAALPRFWLKKANLSGVFQDVSASGSMTDLTSDPTRVGRPFRLMLDGKQNAHIFSAQGVFDHVGNNNKDSISLQANGFRVNELAGAAAELFSSGEGTVDLAMSLLDENNIGGQLTLSLQGLIFDDKILAAHVGVKANGDTSKEDQLKTKFITDVARAIEKLPHVEVTAQIFGTWTDPGLKISSNLGATLSSVIKNSVGDMVKDQKKQLEARLDQVVKDKTAEIQSKLSDLDSKLNGKLGPIDANLQDKINELTGINMGSGAGSEGSSSGIKIPSLDKLFKK